MDIQKIKDLKLPPLEQRYEVRDTILYALGLGYGADPLDEAELPFVYEENLKTVPSLVSLLCHPGFWLRDPIYGVDWIKILHAEQDFRIHKPLPASGTIRGTYRVAGIEDKGADKGAVLHQEKSLYDTADNALLATVRSTLFMRANGGEGGFGDAMPPAEVLPAGDPHKIIEYPTLERQALIYRLSGDWNPLHADPKVARKAGFDKPILHGLCVNGIACRGILSAYCGNDPARLKSMFVRFSKPVFPGETIRLEFYEEKTRLRFRAIAKERNVVVLDRCSAEVA